MRTFLRGFEEALDGLDEAFRGRLLEAGAGGAAGSAEPGGGEGAAAGAATSDAPGADPAAVEAALDVLRRDAEASRALVRLVAAQASVSSQLIDNLNASIHVRALLTDVFVLGELVGA